MISPVNSVVLIGFAEALSAPEVVWSLIDAGFEVSAFGRKDRKSALRRSRYASVIEVTSPELDAAATVREVQSLMRSLCTSFPGKVVVLFPLDDSAVWLCSQVVDNLYLGETRRAGH